MPVLLSAVQTSFEMGLRFKVIRQKSFCCYAFPSSNPVATIGENALSWKSLGQHNPRT